MKKFNYILVLIGIALSLTGCINKSVNSCNNTNTQDTNQQSFSAGFNEENYIWEKYLFPTNKTTGRQ